MACSHDSGVPSEFVRPKASTQWRVSTEAMGRLAGGSKVTAGSVLSVSGITSLVAGETTLGVALDSLGDSGASGGGGGNG